MATKKSLFEQMLQSAEATLDALKAPFVKKQVKRKISSTSDSVELELIQARQDLNKEYSKLDKMDVNTCITIKAKIALLETDMENINQIHIDLFSTPLPEAED